MEMKTQAEPKKLADSESKRAKHTEVGKETKETEQEEKPWELT